MLQVLRERTLRNCQRPAPSDDDTTRLPQGYTSLYSAAMEVDGLSRLRDLLATRAVSPPVVGHGTKEAAVSVVLREAADPELLLIRRAERAGDPWSGHMAFPGGTRRPEDSDLLTTAIRETREEAGIPLDRVGELLGGLDVVRPGTSRLPPILIAPFVMAVPADTAATPDQQEVVDAFWIPLSYLRDERNSRDFLLDLEKERRRFPSVWYGEQAIWGLTHRILAQFLEMAGRAGL